MYHICQFSLRRLQVESRAIGREVQVWFRLLKKKVSFSALSSVQLPLGVLLRVKLGGTNRMKIFPLILLYSSLCCNKVVTTVVTTLYHGCYRVNYNANTRLLQPCFMVVTTMFHGCYNLELQPCYNLVAPL